MYCKKWGSCEYPNQNHKDCQVMTCFKSKNETAKSPTPLGQTELALLCDQPGPECKYYEFYSRVSCLFVEGVEFMSKDAIYAAIKAEWAGLDT